MTVSQLIEALEKMPQDAVVEIRRTGEAMCAEDVAPGIPFLDQDGIVQL